MQVEIKGISHSGEGIGRIDGKATFIPFAIPGEIVEVKLREEKKNYNRGKLIDIVESSPHRVEPICPHYYECGACSYQHVDYPYQLELKRQVVENNISRIAKLDIDVEPVLNSGKIYRYRNKVTWHTDGKGKLGYYQRGTNKLVVIKTCKLISDQMEKATNWCRENINEFPLTSKSKIIIRESSVNGKPTVMLTNLNARLNDKLISKWSHEIPALFVNHMGKPKYEKLFGPDKTEEKAGGIDILLSPGAFFQVNHSQMEVIINLIGKYLDLDKNDILLDAYCGAGGLSLPLAQKVKQVIGIESFAPAIDDAKENARFNNLHNCEFLVGYAEKILPELKTSFNKVIVDPPRSGLKREAIEAITTANPEKIVYVSCNPATLARDLGIFSSSGYVIEKIQPMDMFPQTSHIETVVLLSRKNPDDRIEIDLSLDELDITSAESKATYEEIKDYALTNHSIKVSSLYISQVKRKLGLEVGTNYNLPKSKNARVPQCPLNKEKAITEALNHFRMI